MKAQNAEALGQLADTIDNLMAATTLPLPTEMHLYGLTGSLPDVAVKLKAIYVDETGENPWGKSTDEMSYEELNELTNEFIGSGDEYGNFYTFWSNFLSEDPNLAETAKLLKKLGEWGYVFDENGY